MLSYIPAFIPSTFVVYGVGGTGSRLVPLLAQFVKSCPWVVNPIIYLIDFDVVEEKNLARQNFVSRDIGKYKSDVLAERYSKAFDVNIISIPEKLTDISRETRLKSRDLTSNTMHIMCVDSPEARREILSTLYNHIYNYSRIGYLSNNLLILDSGNENDFGQVTISGLLSAGGPTLYERKSLAAIPDMFPLSEKLDNIPLDVKYFTEMKSEIKESCAELDQTMAINSLVASTLFSVIQTVLYCKPISYNRIDVSLSHGSTPHYITPSMLVEMGEYSPPNSVSNAASFQSGTWNKSLSTFSPDLFTSTFEKKCAKFQEQMSEASTAKLVETPADLVEVKKAKKKKAGSEAAIEPDDIPF